MSKDSKFKDSFNLAKAWSDYIAMWLRLVFLLTLLAYFGERFFEEGDPIFQVLSLFSLIATVGMFCLIFRVTAAAIAYQFGSKYYIKIISFLISFMLVITIFIGIVDFLDSTNL